MRLLHPTTITILASHPEFPKTHLAHAWSEVFKFLAQDKSHPKMFLPSHEHYGNYLSFIYQETRDKGYNLDKEKINKLSSEVKKGWEWYQEDLNIFESHFDDDYLFSDACSLYYKGINIFPDIYDDNWRKYVPVESLKEIQRQVTKTLSK
jgi:hypothetical protein